MLVTVSSPSELALFVLMCCVVLSLGFEALKWNLGPAASSSFMNLAFTKHTCVRYANSSLRLFLDLCPGKALKGV